MGEPDQISDILVQKMRLEPRQQTVSSTSSPPASAGAGAAKKPSWKKDYTLPPCKVCGGEGSGIHYGVNTCEACKGFFRRSLARKETYKCRQNHKCQLEAGKRNMCSACRFKKCLEIGMSTEGIKIGRYTTEKRRQDTLEVKQIKADSAMSSQRGHEKDTEKRMAEFVETVVDAGRKNFDQLHELHVEIQFLQRELNEKSKTTRDLITALELLSADDFNNYLMDLEPDQNLQARMYEKCISFTEKLIRKYIKFAKSVPGFKKLPMDDQIALVKASHSDITTLYKYQNAPLSPGAGSGSCTLHPDMAKKLFQTATKFRALELTDDELQMLNAMLLVSPDRCTLTDNDTATFIQDNITQSMQWLLAKNHDSSQIVFARLISIITEMRSFSESTRYMTRMCMQKIARTEGVTTAIPALIWEIMS